MFEPAELGTLTPEGPGAIGPEERPRRMSRDQIGLAMEVGYPEAVDDVGRLQFEADGAADGDVNLVGRGDHVTRSRGLVLDPPPPLMTGYLDREVALITQPADR